MCVSSTADTVASPAADVAAAASSTATAAGVQTFSKQLPNKND